MLSFCGIDVSKDRLDVIVLPEQQSFAVRNDAPGWAELIARLRGFAVAAIGLELQNDIASWSVRSTHRIVCDARHNIQFDRPDAVVAAILEVVSEVRSDPPSRAPDASLH